MKCNYCEETSNYKPLIVKPIFFISDDKIISTAMINPTIKDVTCLECLQVEIEAFINN
jgi:hypothetical protein